MTIGIVGGVERDRTKYAHIAARAGHQVEYHPGHAGGRGTEVIRAMVARCDLVVVITDVNSHQGVKVARDAAVLGKRRFVMVRRCSPSRFAAIIAGEVRA